MTNFSIIQGGMGIGVSGWRLANAVSRTGQLGVVSGTALEVVFARRLQSGDVGGHLRRALKDFPLRRAAEEILGKYFIEGGKAPGTPFRPVSIATARPSEELVRLIVAACFCEVKLAKEGHSGVVGMNLLEKIRLTCLPALYGSMLAGVDYVLMGAGIPRRIPGVLDAFAEGRPGEIVSEIEGAPAGMDPLTLRFDPEEFFVEKPPALKRPKFIAIVGSHVLATTLMKKSTGRVDGFVVEGAPAGGHNSPPRSKEYTPAGEPVYGPRDEADLGVIAALGVPFWLAGGRSTPEGLAAALAAKASGVQIGTAFAFCEESDMGEGIKCRVIEASRTGKAAVFTDPHASPTGFPFKLVKLEDTLYDENVYSVRERVCDVGHLRTPCYTPEGKLAYRCPSAPENLWTSRGGDIAEVEGRKCLCNGLLSAIDLGQIRSDGRMEPPMVTAGSEVAHVIDFVEPGAHSYPAEAVIRRVMGGAIRAGA